MANFLVTSLIWDITATMDLTLIERRNLRIQWNVYLCVALSHTKNLVQNYSDHFGNSQRSSLSPTEYNHDTNYINKHKGANHDTRKLHLWARHEERAVSVFLDVVSYTANWLKMSLSLHFIPSSCMSISPWPHLPPFLLRPGVLRLLPLLCPDAPWALHRPRQPWHRGKQPAHLREQWE